jgi:serine protease Do
MQDSKTQRKLLQLLDKNTCRLLVVTLAISGIFWYKFSLKITTAQNVITKYVLPNDPDNSDIYHLTQSETVRVVKTDSAGSGVMIDKQGDIYTVITNWHVVNQDNSPIILTADDQQYQLIQPPKQIGQLDLALLQFKSKIQYSTAEISTKIPAVGEKVYAAGFPLTIGKIENTVSLGNQAFRLTQGQISLVPAKSFPEGYRLGYTNETQPGMSGSPIFDADGKLIGIHGRGKYRDPGFGVYIFEDGSEPQPKDLKVMVESSWGIPITTYLEFQ